MAHIQDFSDSKEAPGTFGVFLKFLSILFCILLNDESAKFRGIYAEAQKIAYLFEIFLGR